MNSSHLTTQIYKPLGRITIGPHFGPSNAISHRPILLLAVYRLSRLVNLTIYLYQMSYPTSLSSCQNAAWVRLSLVSVSPLPGRVSLAGYPPVPVATGVPVVPCASVRSPYDWCLPSNRSTSWLVPVGLTTNWSAGSWVETGPSPSGSALVRMSTTALLSNQVEELGAM